MAADLSRERPLAGLVLCCTSIPPDARHALSASAIQMGADHKYDLTSDVTHLVVGNIDTQKYGYVAKERPDVKIVLPEFIEAVRVQWMQGGETNVAELEKEYHVKTFWGLQICLTGFDDVNQREHIKSLAETNGANYHGDLTKIVTHLIAAAPVGKKYEHARRWGIKVVSIEWLDHSLERGMVLDESLYDPTMAPEERGKNAWNKQALEVIIQRKRLREENPEVVSQNKRKIRRTMSVRLGSQQGSMWAEMASAGSAQAAQDEWQPVEFDGVLGAIPPHLDSKSADTTPNPTVEPPKTKASPPERKIKPQVKGVFRGKLVYIHGFTGAKLEILQNHLESHGARLCISPADTEDEDLGDGCLLIPHDVPEDSLQPVPAPASEWQRVTEWWVESCLASKVLVKPEDEPLCRPFSNLAIQGCKGMTISVTGFTGVELLHVVKAIKIMGATYEDFLVAERSLLLCKSTVRNQDKLDFAADNGVPVVSEKWLLACLKEGVKQSFESYELSQETPTVPLKRDSKKFSSKSLGKAKLPSKPDRPQQLQFQKHATKRKESLPLKPTKSLRLSPAKSKRVGPFTEEDLDDDQEPAIAPRVVEDEIPYFPSLPLRELSQGEVNSLSPRRSISADKEAPPAASAPSTDLSKNPSSANSSSAHLTETIAALLAQSKERSNSAALEEEVDALTKRRKGKLGRAISGSFGSSNGLSRTSSTDAAYVPAYDQEKKPDQAPPMPSQKILYETEEREEKAKLIARLGGKVMDPAEYDATVVAKSIGTVKELMVGDPGGMRRRRGRQ
ncbi:putative vacuolar protein sorting-associated protein 16 [Venturia nashicola]|nr:putative vacuolar protein sorting-associated protein 16 [Venturia nashicola]